MSTMRPILAVPILIVASAATVLADVRDKAKMFGADVVSQANTQIGKLERTFNIPITIETTPSLDGVDIDKAIPEYARRDNVRGLFILIARREGKIQAEASREYQKYFTRPRFQAIYKPFLPGFKRKDYDGALVAGVTELFNTLQTVKSEFGAITPVDPRTNPAPAGRRPVGAAAPQAKGGFPMFGLIGIIVLILGVVFVVRILGALMGSGRHQNYGGPGYGPGGGGPMQGPGGYGGPGYGGGGYGGQPARGGGFMSSMFGGIGGAMAGNWLYDRFGRSHQDPSSGYAPGAESAPADAGPDWSGANDGGGSWGGDAGAGGGGGGGDWGGGGGGGGGDWGGSDGGSWGGGGGSDGGSW